MRDDSMSAYWISDFIETAVGKIPRVETALSFRDRLGSWKCRWARAYRMNYPVEPGLYAVGSPDSGSPVFVSANYKMSFDILRSRLTGMSAWILVLDTQGINVWCAAGKRTFSTDEIVDKINETDLSNVVRHKTLIVPQLGAPGVSAHEVRKRSGYRVVYGPVRASDIPEFMNNNMKASPKMRRVRFKLLDRLALSPMEVLMWGRRMFWGTRAWIIIAVLLFVSGIDRTGFQLGKVVRFGLPGIIMYSTAFLSGSLFAPLLLPWLPGRAFSTKGAVLGLALAAAAGWYRWGAAASVGLRLNILAWLFLVPAISSFIAVTFVGSSTYTSSSGVFKEMKRAVPVQLTLIGVGILLLITGQLV